MEIELVTGRDEPSDVDRRQRRVLAKDKSDEEMLDPAPLRDGDEINVSTFLIYSNGRKRASCMCGTSNMLQIDNAKSHKETRNGVTLHLSLLARFERSNTFGTIMQTLSHRISCSESRVCNLFVSKLLRTFQTSFTSGHSLQSSLHRVSSIA
jgi:hypothetical protein